MTPTQGFMRIVHRELRRLPGDVPNYRYGRDFRIAQGIQKALDLGDVVFSHLPKNVSRIRMRLDFIDPTMTGIA